MIKGHITLRSHQPIEAAIRELIDATVRWFSAEVGVARLEIADLRQRLFTAAVLGLGVVIALFCALFILAQAGVAWATVYLGNAALAGAIVGGILLLIAVGFIFAMRGVLSWRAESLLFRWLTTPPDKDNKDE